MAQKGFTCELSTAMVFIVNVSILMYFMHGCIRWGLEIYLSGCAVPSAHKETQTDVASPFQICRVVPLRAHDIEKEKLSQRDPN